jgi:integrase/recombinase XerD
MKSPDLNGWIQRYFKEYLVRQRNVSPATVAAYRDTFRLLLRYLRQNAAETRTHKFSPDDKLLRFLDSL